MKQIKSVLLFSVLLIMVSIGSVNMSGKQSPQIRKIKKIRTVRMAHGIKRLKVLKNRLIGPLLETKWGQRGEYARFAPRIKSGSNDRFRLGCWSTALAQILYYHRLKPFGTVPPYTTSINSSCIGEDGKPCEIVQPPHNNFDWNEFVDEIGHNTPENKIEEVARYCYYTAVVVEKDFGTGDYILTKHSERANAVSTHYNTIAHLYSTKKNKDSLGEIKQIICEEIINARPLMMHMRSVKVGGKRHYHAVVVDGAGYIGQRFIIHINMGLMGRDNAWYDFDHIDETYNDDNYRKIITIKPLKRIRPIEKLLLKTPDKYSLGRGKVTYYFPTSRGGWESRVGKTPRILVSKLPRSLGESALKSQ